MAGGRMSPRQKMINLMYLVLIAMLALNVDTKVLKKFIMINQSFESSNAEKVVDNTNKVESIRGAVDDSGNRKKDVAVLNLSETIRKKSDSIINYMSGIKNIIVSETGGKKDNGEIKGYKDIDFVYRYMKSDNSGEGEGTTLQIILNNFSTFIQDSVFLGDESSGIHDIARNADQIPLYADDLPTNPSFSSLNFGFGTSTGAGLATMSQLQSDVINLEVKALEKLAAKVGAADLKFDVVTLTTLPEQTVVAAGAKYITQIFLSAASSVIVPTMTADGDTLDVTNGRGYYEFIAQGGGYDKDGKVKKSYIGTISVTLPGGKDTTFVDTIDYYVARPVIQIQSASVQALYFNCGNEIQVNVPALGTNYNPTFSVTGGDIERGGKAGQITIIPKSTSKVTINVNNAGNFIGSKSFGVRQIPAPEMVPTLRGGCPKQSNCDVISLKNAANLILKNGISSTTPRINIDAFSDPSFAEFLPKDSQFRVMEANIIKFRGGSGTRPMPFTGRSFDLNKIGDIRSGDMLSIEITKVVRANFKGAIEEFKNYSPKILRIPIQ